MKIRLLLLVAICEIVAVNQSRAHHGLGEYDTSAVVEFTGQVVGFELVDPHSLLHVDVENADGSITRWTVEGGPAHGIIGSGVTRESLSFNPIVTVRGYQSKDKRCEPRCRANGRDFAFE